MTTDPSARRSPISRLQFIDDLRTALREETGYAAGRLSYSHVYRLSYRLMSERLRYPEHFLREGVPRLHFESLNQLGIYPADLDFYPRFDTFWVGHLRNLDVVGLFPDRLGPSTRILDHYGVPGKRMDYHEQEPDRSVPSREEHCYLPLFRGRRVLLVCPFAELLRERATPETFEAVWARTGKRWFHPDSVDALEIPYGFARETHARHPDTVLDLFSAIEQKITEREFDIALIGAAGLAVPIASTVKSLGRIAIDLGGHIQILFGVLGKRWRHWQDWQESYFNDAWIDMPARYRPVESDVCDSGAYW